MEISVYLTKEDVKRLSNGEVVKLKTDIGRKLSITPNMKKSRFRVYR